MNGMRVGAGARERHYPSTTDTYDIERDLDYVAIERVLNGDPVRLTPAEKIHAAQLLDARSFTLADISRRVGTDPSTVRGWKANGWKPGKPTQAPKQQRPAPTCGEPRMYRRHLARGETPCDACRAGNAAADRRYRLTGSQQQRAAA
jgi:hypothetical protein